MVWAANGPYTVRLECVCFKVLESPFSYLPCMLLLYAYPSLSLSVFRILFYIWNILNWATEMLTTIIYTVEMRTVIWLPTKLRTHVYVSFTNYILFRGEVFIGIQFCWDGADMFNYSMKSIWPLSVSILNFPKELRDKMNIGLHVVAMCSGVRRVCFVHVSVMYLSCIWWMSIPYCEINVLNTMLLYGIVSTSDPSGQRLCLTRIFSLFHQVF